MSQRQNNVSIDLMQRIWANLYFNEEEAGNTFQQTLNEVTDWLVERGVVPAAPLDQEALLDDALSQIESWRPL